MKTARTIGLGLGLILLLGVEAGTFSRAQQTGREAERQVRAKPLTTETLARLEADVELLHVEHEVAKGDLMDFLKKCNRLEHLQELDFMTSMGLTLAFEREFISKDSAQEAGKAMALALCLAGEQETKKFELAASEDVKKLFRSLRTSRDRKRKEFLEKTQELKNKRRELAEAEKQYQSEAR